MKKFTLLLLCFFTFGFVHAESSFYVGEGGENHTIMFAESTLENGFFDKSDIWITDKIKANLISSLQCYGGFNCIDLAEAKNILKVQKQLESGIYDDSQSIEIGKLVKAKEVVNIKTTRLPSGSYSINITIFNVEKGTIIGMFSSPKTYESAESYVLQAHYDCVSPILKQLKVKPTQEGKSALEEDKKTAETQAEKNKAVALENAKLEAERSEMAEKQAKIVAEEKARKEAQEKAEYERNQKILADKKAKEAEAYAKAKQQNPFAKETYVTEFENGSKYDSYSVKFTSQTECTITVISEDTKGNKHIYSNSGSYSYGDNILSVNARFANQEIKHVQKINWKGQINFKNGYNNFYLMIPVTSNENAKKIRAEFRKK